MGEVYGIVLTVVFGILFSASTVGIIIKRHHPIIKCRDPFLLVVQSVGSILGATITSLYIGLRPSFSCYLYYAGQLLAYAALGYPLIIRCWEYGVNLHLSKIRSKFRQNVLDPDSGDKSWFVRNRWATRLNFLHKAFFIGFWIWFFPLIPYCIVQGQFDYDPLSGGCRSYAGVAVISIAFMIIFFAASLAIVVLTWNLQDAYKIKFELKVISISWIVLFVIYIPYGLAKFEFQRHISASFFILLGFYVTLFMSTVYPLYLVKSESIVTAGLATAGFEEFVDQLEFLPFRNAFREYLALRFCQENILFYENVCDWKRMSRSDTDRSLTALAILNNYILETGLLQINISGPARDKISRNLAQEEIPNDLFDDAIGAVLGNMHANAYYQFKAHPLYFSAKA